MARKWAATRRGRRSWGALVDGGRFKCFWNGPTLAGVSIFFFLKKRKEKSSAFTKGTQRIPSAVCGNLRKHKLASGDAETINRKQRRAKPEDVQHYYIVSVPNGPEPRVCLTRNALTVNPDWLWRRSLVKPVCLVAALRKFTWNLILRTNVKLLLLTGNVIRVGKRRFKSSACHLWALIELEEVISDLDLDGVSDFEAPINTFRIIQYNAQ